MIPRPTTFACGPLAYFTLSPLAVQLRAAGEFFSDDAMLSRAPGLFHQYTRGQVQRSSDASTRTRVQGPTAKAGAAEPEHEREVLEEEVGGVARPICGDAARAVPAKHILASTSRSGALDSRPPPRPALVPRGAAALAATGGAPLMGAGMVSSSHP